MDLLPEFEKPKKVLSVAELTRSIRGALETRFNAVWVYGEISNYKQHPSGHQYFTLKDQRAQISCVIWKDAIARRTSGQPLADGTQVQVYGNVTVFEARGQYQLSVQILQPRGLGLLQARFEALKRKLEAEGLFAAERKRPLPKFPRRIGLVTSPSGAALRDILNVVQRRAPWLHILISPVRVQGSGAAQEIAVAIRELAQPNESFARPDVIVVARGGGSMEDLWQFNEEIVARAIAAIDIPLVSAVGHEIDFTICDFVADLRAPTPSAAAELIVPDVTDLRRHIDAQARVISRELFNCLRDAQQRLDHAHGTLRRCLGHKLDQYKRGLVHLAAALQARSPTRELGLRRNRLLELQRRLRELPTRVLESAQHRFRRTESVLRVLGPEATLRRGYSITMDEHGKLIRSVSAVTRKMRIRTRLADGEFRSEVAAEPTEAS